MKAGFSVKQYLSTCKDLSLTTENIFEKSEYIPVSDDVAILAKDILTNLMADTSVTSLKLTLSGPISGDGKGSMKKQSFCSEFNQMIKNIIGLMGFEFSKYLMIHMGTFEFIDIIINDMELSTSYDELLKYTLYIYNLLKPNSKSTYKFIETQMNPRINPLMVNEDMTMNFFEYERSILLQHIESKNITQFVTHKQELIDRIRKFMSNIIEGSKTFESIDDLVIPNMGEYTIVYDGSFLKIFEILYKSIHADNPKFNEKNLITVNNYDVVERYINEVIRLPHQPLSYYLNSLEQYFHGIYIKTRETLITDSNISANVKKMEVNLSSRTSSPLTYSLARIAITVICRLTKLINWKKNFMLMLTSPSRIQFAQILEAMFCLPSGIDIEYTESQLYVIYYILSCAKVSKITKMKKELKESGKVRKPRKTKKEREAEKLQTENTE